MIKMFESALSGYSKRMFRSKKISMKRRCTGRAAILLCMLLALLCSCRKSDEPWGTYKTAPGPDGNYKCVEFAYSKSFYTKDYFAAQAAAENTDQTEDVPDAMSEGWYTVEDKTVTCVYTDTVEDKTVTSEYKFEWDTQANALTLTEIRTARDGESDTVTICEERYTQAE